MAFKYECDRCGSQTTDRSGIGTVEYPIVNAFTEVSDTSHKDLCIKCIRELHDFLKPLPKLVEPRTALGSLD